MIFVVEAWNQWEDFTHHGAFSTREKALEAIEKQLDETGYPYDFYGISTLGLDKHYVDEYNSEYARPSAEIVYDFHERDRDKDAHSREKRAFHRR